MRLPAIFKLPGLGFAGILVVLLGVALAGCNGGGSSSGGKTDPPADSNKKSEQLVPQANAADQKACREAVESLLKYASNGKNAEAAPLLVYRGKNKEREWKSVCDYSRQEDRLYVDKTMAKLQVMTMGIDSHSFQEFLTEQEKEGTWYVWIVNMKYEDESSDQKAFAFLKVKGKFALGDID